MRYNLKDGYGKRAYSELQEIKRYVGINSNDNLELNRKNTRKNLQYYIYSKSTNINYNINITGRRSNGIVNIYGNNDTNGDIFIKLKNNGVIVYRNKLRNSSIGFVYDTTNNVSIEIDNPEMIDLELMIEFVGDFDTSISNKKIDNIDDKVVVADCGFDNTYVTIYETITDLENAQYSSIYSLPIELLDMKTVTDNACFTGTDCVVLGFNISHQLVYYRLSEDFATGHVLLDDCMTARISGDTHSYRVYFVVNNKLKYIRFDNEGKTISKDVEIGKRIKIADLISATVSVDEYRHYTYLAIRSTRNDVYLINHCTQEGTDYETVSLMNIANARSVSISVVDDVAKLYLNNNYSTDVYSLEFNIDTNIVNIKKVSSICPCENVVNLKLGNLIVYKNNITVG